jgi:nickel transport protein
MRLAALVLLLAVDASAHDLALRVEQSEPTVIVYAAYGGSEPVTDADVSIFSPANPDSPFQTGLTDIRGIFAFVPSDAGEWRVVLDDGYGHRAERMIAVDWQAATDRPATGERSTFDKAVLGLSLIFGWTGVLLWVQSRRRTKPS